MIYRVFVLFFLKKKLNQNMSTKNVPSTQRQPPLVSSNARNVYDLRQRIIDSFNYELTVYFVDQYGEPLVYRAQNLESSPSAQASSSASNKLLWKMNFFDVESYIEDIYKFVSFRLGVDLSSFQLFYNNFCLGLSYIKSDEILRNIPFDIDKYADFSDNVNVFYDFQTITNNSLGMVDNMRSVFYERIMHIDPFSEVYFVNTSEINIQVIFDSRLWQPSAEKGHEKFFKYIFDNVKAAGWAREEIVKTDPRKSLNARLLDLGKLSTEYYVDNIQTERVRWDICEEIKGQHFDLIDFFESFKLDLQIPFIQLIDYSGNKENDLETSRVKIFSPWIDEAKFKLLYSWKMDIKSNFREYYHPLKSVLCKFYYDNILVTAIVQGTGSVVFDFDFKHQNISKKYSDLLMMLDKIVEDLLLLAHQTNHASNIFGHFFSKLLVWNKSLIFIYKSKKISFSQNRFGLQEVIQESGLQQWLKVMKPFYRKVQERATKKTRVMNHLRYKRIGNFRENIYDLINSFVYFNKLPRQNVAVMEKKIAEFLDGFDLSDQEKNTYIETYLKDKMKKYGFKYIKFNDGIDLLLTRGIGNETYTVYLNGGSVNTIQFFHCLFTTNIFSSSTIIADGQM
jgi:hypothetical protein